MAEDPKTRSLFFCVMDGHGEDGDKVSQAIKAKFANYLFKHRDFATDIKSALAEVIDKCEKEVLRGFTLLSLPIYLHTYSIPTIFTTTLLDTGIETEFSGTTFTCAVIRNNLCTLANIGDSRSSLGFRNAAGGVTAVALTDDHKPDLPAEKVKPPLLPYNCSH